MKEKKVVRVSSSIFRDTLPPDSIRAGNAYGTVVMREQVREGFDLWNDLPIMCGHGGSAWLCYCCAEAILKGEPCSVHIQKAKQIVNTLGSGIRTSWHSTELQAFRDLGMKSPLDI